MKRARLWSGTLALLVAFAWAGPATAGDPNGNFMVRVLGAVVDPDTDIGAIRLNGTAIPGADAEVDTEVIPAATLTYFFNKNVAVELFCCFANIGVDAKGSLAQAGFGKLGTSWIFPPVVTLQYHFDGMGGFKPYVGAGVQYIAFFDEGSNIGGNLDIDNAFGFALQAGVDVSLGDGWYLNADVKKIWLDTDVTWDLGGGNRIQADVDLDPWIISAGVGYRFNLSDLFGRRSAPSLK